MFNEVFWGGKNKPPQNLESIVLIAFETNSIDLDIRPTGYIAFEAYLDLGMPLGSNPSKLDG